MNNEQQAKQHILNKLKSKYEKPTLEEFLTKNVYIKTKEGMKLYGFKNGYAFWKDIIRKSQNHPDVTFLKSAQIGYSMGTLGRVIWKILGTSYKAGIYFPDDTSMKDFVQDRVNTFIDSCKIVKDALKESVDNTRIKKIGQSTLAMRGTWTKRGTKTIDLDIVMLDEVDEHDEENIEFVGDRLLASDLRWIIRGSQPSLPNFGIHKNFLESDQHYWLIKCPKCNYWNDLIENFKQDQQSIFRVSGGQTFLSDQSIYYPCIKCSAKLDNQKGEYVAKKPSQKDKMGFQISQLFTGLAPSVIYKKLTDADTQSRKKNVIISMIGLPYATDEETPLTLEIIQRQEQNYTIPEKADYFTYFGADQGDTVHAVFAEPTLTGKLRIIGFYKGHILEDERLSRYIEKYQVYSGNVDAMPNRNWSIRLALKYNGIIRIQHFTKKYGERVEILPEEQQVEVMNANRDESLQDTVDAIKNGLFIFPNPTNLSREDMSLYEEFKYHLTMLTKESKIDEYGKTIWQFKKAVQNHYGMALNSLRLAYTKGTEHNNPIQF